MLRPNSDVVSSDADHPLEKSIINPDTDTLVLFRGIGYGLLLLSIIDLLYILIPLELTNPVWEYQTIGDLVKLVPVPLLALMLIFYRGAIARYRLEHRLLFLLSWLTLFIGIFFFLLVPLTLSNTARIGRFNTEQIDTQVNKQKLQLETTRQQLNQATPEQLQRFVPAPDQQGKLPDAPATPEQAKDQLLQSLEQAQKRADNQAIQARSNLRRNLAKNTIKLIAGSSIAGAVFIYCWRMTRWARRRSPLAPIHSAATPSKRFLLPKKRSPFRRRSSVKGQ